MSNQPLNNSNLAQAHLNSDPTQQIQLIIQCLRSGNLEDADMHCKHLVELFPQHPAVLHYAGFTALRRKEPEEAIVYFQRAVEFEPNNPILLNMLGVTYCELNDLETGIDHYQHALEIRPDYAEVYCNLAMALARKGDPNQAAMHYRQAIKLNPNNPVAYNHLGNLLQQINDMEEAVSVYQTALTMQPNFAECHYNLGAALQNQKDYKKALRSYRRALAHRPDYLHAHHYAGVVLSKMERHEEAIQHFVEALALDPNTLSRHLLIAEAYSKLQKPEQAIGTYREGLEKDPHHIELLENMVRTLQACCSWEEWTHFKNQLLALSEYNLTHGLPFLCWFYLWLDLSAEKQFAIAKNIAQHRFSKLTFLRQQLGFTFNRLPKAKLRIGYVSADLARDHPAAHSAMSLFGYHDHERFETYLYLIGPRDNSIYGQRIPSLFDHVCDLTDRTTQECAKQIYQDNIDILIDVMGYTENSNPFIFELKPAPIQCSFFGWPGTMGVDFIDYVIADQVIIPPDQAQYYSEKLLYMPNSYLVTNDQQIIAPTKFSRQDFGLPEDSFVFCCFNNTAKIDPIVFSVWMRILQQVPRAVLWLFSDVPTAEDNLRKEAEKQGIARERIIFTGRLPKADHLARMQLADLFLDCFVVSAHTTASDALWAGVPIITLPGKNWISRVCASALMAIGLPELIAEDAQQYETLALHYAQSPAALRALREKLANNKKTQPLFNTRQFAQDLEKGLEKIWQIYLQNDSPKSIVTIVE